MKFIEWMKLDLSDYLKINPINLKYWWDRGDSLPTNEYSVYQLEQLTVSSKMDSYYVNLINNSREVLDYSSTNVELNPSHIFTPYLPNLNSSYHDTEKDIDILFYGYLSPRRCEKIKELEQTYKVHVTDNLTKIELSELIKKSKWVLSYGTWGNLHNDSFRTTPALNMGGNIMMERFSEEWYNEYLLDNFKDRIKLI